MRNPLSSLGCSVINWSWRGRWRTETLVDLVACAVLPAMAAAAVGILWVIDGGCSSRRGLLLLRRLFWPLNEVLWSPNNLATKRAESEGIKKTPFTDFTGIGDTFARPRLWSLIQENNFCTVDNVGLNGSDIQKFLYFIHPYHIMVRWPPNLNGTMVLMMR